MTEVLLKIEELQGSKRPEDNAATTRVQELEKQLANMTDKRIDYMERLQEQQLAMQVKLIHVVVTLSELS